MIIRVQYLAKNYDLALLGPDGNLLPVNQHEYWIDPANDKARHLVLSLLEEIVKNYDVDGVQLDYIRYPFQRSDTQMGFGIEGRHKFEIETGCSLDNLDQNTIKTWNNWKKNQISSFVKESSEHLHKIKPNIQISAAVYGGDRRKRFNTIQQDWERWVNQGWIDILNPMIYSSNTSQLTENLDYIIKSVNDKVLVYPGIAVRQLEDVDLLEQIYTIKDLGLFGNTIFAMAHPGNEKSDLLSSGPYRFKEAKVPNDNPINSANEFIEEFLEKINNIKLNSKDESLAYNYSADEVITDAEKVHNYIQNLTGQHTPAKIDIAITMIQNLESLTKTWMATEKQVKPLRVKLMNCYLKNAESLLSFQQHKKILKDNSYNTALK